MTWATAVTELSTTEMREICFFPHNLHAGLKAHFTDFDLKNNILALCKLAVTNTQCFLLFSLFKEKQSVG